MLSPSREIPYKNRDETIESDLFQLLFHHINQLFRI